MLDQKLSIPQQQTLLKELYGYELINVNADRGGYHWVIHTEEGQEFYGNDANLPFSFDTLRGFFHYTAYLNRDLGERNGRQEVRHQITKALGL